MSDPRAVNCRAYTQTTAGLVTGVELGITPIPGAVYELYAVRLIDEAAAAGNTIATCSVLDKNGIAVGEQVRLTWPGKQPPFADSGIAGNGANVHVIVNGFSPPAIGPLALHVGAFNAPTSDIVWGLGLPFNHHVSFVVIFIEKGAIAPTDPTDPALAARLAKVEAELISQAQAELLDDAADVKHFAALDASMRLRSTENKALAARADALEGKVTALASGYAAQVGKTAAVEQSLLAMTKRTIALESAAVAASNRFQAAEAVAADLAARLGVLESGQGGSGGYPYPLPSHRFGVHLIPDGNLPANLDYIRRLKPAAVKVINGNKETLQAVLALLDPNGLLIVRDHARSEQQDFLARDPTGCGKQHALEWKNDFASNGKYAGLNSNRVVVCGLNEPRVGDAIEEEKVVKYTTAFLNDLSAYGIRGLCLNLSVGWPRNAGASTPPNWEIYKPLESIINQSPGHIMGLHEYWYADPDENWANMPSGVPFGWLAFRHMACPLQVPILIGECGMTKAVDETRWVNEGKPPRGWVGNVTPSQYAEMYARYTKKTSPNVIATMLFTTGFASEDWREDSTDTAHNGIVARKVAHVFPADFPIRPPAAGAVVLPPADSDLLILPKIVGLVTGFYGSLYSGKNAAGATYQYAHEGLDLRKLLNTPVLMPYDGIIAHVGTAAEASPYGLYIRTLHRDLDVCFFVGHLSKTMVSDGDIVKQGTVIGLAGTTGNSTGVHEHFEVRFLVEGQNVYEPETSAHANARGDIISYVRGFKHRGRVEYR